MTDELRLLYLERDNYPSNSFEWWKLTVIIARFIEYESNACRITMSHKDVKYTRQSKG